MEHLDITLILVVIAVAIYDFTNGFHDAADMVTIAMESRAMETGISRPPPPGQ